MRIAVASEGPLVSEHFGHCSQFAIFDTSGSDVTAQRWVDNPGHKPGFLPVFLKEQGVDVVIAGGMGRMARELFEAQGIQAVTGVTGMIGDVVREYLLGRVRDSGAVCAHHGNHDCNHD